jgi:hypothetical protein
MESGKFTKGDVVRALNKNIEPRTESGHLLPNLEVDKAYTINYSAFREGQWWYGVEGIFNTVYTEDEL